MWVAHHRKENGNGLSTALFIIGGALAFAALLNDETTEAALIIWNGYLGGLAHRLVECQSDVDKNGEVLI